MVFCMHRLINTTTVCRHWNLQVTALCFNLNYQCSIIGLAVLTIFICFNLRADTVGSESPDGSCVYKSLPTLRYQPSLVIIIIIIQGDKSGCLLTWPTV